MLSLSPSEGVCVCCAVLSMPSVPCAVSVPSLSVCVRLLRVRRTVERIAANANLRAISTVVRSRILLMILLQFGTPAGSGLTAAAIELRSRPLLVLDKVEW